MEKGKLILNHIICEISFDENPSITFEEKINNNGTKQLTGFQKWKPFKFNVISDYGYNLLGGEYENLYIIYGSVVWKLTKSVINSELNEIIFETLNLYQ